jgi:PST family polysaccharide transporter
MTDSSKNSYGQILKSSSIVGGAQGIKIVISILQIKILAVLVGPTGVGLVGLYQSTIGIVNTICGLGIGQSGVRQVAEAASTGDHRKIGRTIFALRRTTMVLGVLGTILVFVLRNPISRMTFGNTEHGDAFGILALTLFFASVTAGQTALVRGMRKIGDLAKLQVLGAFWGLVFSLPFLYFFGMAGLAPYLAAVAGMAVATSWWYARKIPVPAVALSLKEIWTESKSLISLGVMLMLSGLMTTLVLYLVRVMVVRGFGVEAAGLYQASTQLSNVYVGFILGAMAMDFYPRLTAVSQDSHACNRLVNEQVEVGLLMGTSGLFATVVFAPVVLTAFYSSEFSSAYTILQWQILGTFLRVASWPLGFVLLGKGKGRLFLATETGANFVHVGFFYVAIRWFDLQGAGIAFFGLYVFYLFLMYAVVRRLSGFAWSKPNKRLGMIIAPSVLVVFTLPRFLPQAWAMVFGALFSIGMAVFCLKRLHVLIGSPPPARLIAKARQKLGWGRS